VLTSATLGGGGADPQMRWLRDRLGIAKATTLRLGSPFDFKNRVTLRIEDDLPDPVTAGDAYEREAIDRIRDHCLQNRGGVLILCTSWRFVERCFAQIAQDLEDAGIPLLKQGTVALSQLVQRKRDDPTAVLIGADALWEGIDLPGPTLTLVLIARLPFPVPSHPLTQARSRRIEEHGGSAFFDLFVPEAVLKLRQGFGRLVRRMDDHGKVVVLDPRLETKRYGRTFLAALPECRLELASETM
jgi:ATP-dependent DNA helicase DinG